MLHGITGLSYVDQREPKIHSRSEAIGLDSHCTREQCNCFLEPSCAGVDETCLNERHRVVGTTREIALEGGICFVQPLLLAQHVQQSVHGTGVAGSHLERPKIAFDCGIRFPEADVRLPKTGELLGKPRVASAGTLEVPRRLAPSAVREGIPSQHLVRGPIARVDIEDPLPHGVRVSPESHLPRRQHRVPHHDRHDHRGCQFPSMPGRHGPQEALRAPDDRRQKPNLWYVAVSVRIGLRADLKQTDHRHERHDKPAPSPRNPWPMASGNEEGPADDGEAACRQRHLNPRDAQQRMGIHRTQSRRDDSLPRIPAVAANRVSDAVQQWQATERSEGRHRPGTLRTDRDDGNRCRHEQPCQLFKNHETTIARRTRRDSAAVGQRGCCLPPEIHQE